MRTWPAQHASDRGFTLLELVAVMAILALTVTVALPRAQWAPAGQSVRLAVTEIAAALKAARAHAMRANAEARVVVDGSARRVVADGQARALTLPRGILVAWDVSAMDRVRADAAQIRFKPDGTSSGGTFRISAQRQTAIIRVDWLTGRTDVTWSR